MASHRPCEMDGKIGELEKMYGVLMLEKALGLLSAVLPQDMTVSVWLLLFMMTEFNVLTLFGTYPLDFKAA